MKLNKLTSVLLLFFIVSLIGNPARANKSLLEQLPTDLLSLISRHLDNRGRDANHLALTSKTMRNRLSSAIQKNSAKSSFEASGRIRRHFSDPKDPENEPFLRIASHQNFLRIVAVGYHDLSSIQLSSQLSPGAVKNIITHPAFKNVVQLDLSPQCRNLPEFISELLKLTSIRALKLRGCKQDLLLVDGSLQDSALFQSLERLDLSSTEMNVQQLNQLLSATENLKILKLPNTPNIQFSGIRVKSLSRLVELDVSKNKLTSTDLTWIQNCERLETLILDEVRSESKKTPISIIPIIPTLRTLSLRKLSLEKNAFASLRTLSNLENLSLGQSKVQGGLDIGVLADLRLKVLELSYALTDNEYEVALKNRWPSTLEELELGGFLLFNLKSLPKPEQLPFLAKLYLNSVKLSNESIQTLKNFKNLTELILVGVEGFSTGSNAPSLFDGRDENGNLPSSFPFLRTLHILDSDIPQASLANLSYLKSLRYLKLMHKEGFDFHSFAFLEGLNLESIDLQGTSFNDGDVRYLQAMSNLKSVNLRFCRHLHSFYPSPGSNGELVSHLENLQYLYLDENQLSSQSIEWILGLKNLRKLTLSEILSDAQKSTLKKNNYGLILTLPKVEESRDVQVKTQKN